MKGRCGIYYSCSEVKCPAMNSLDACVKMQPCPAKQRELNEIKEIEERGKNEQAA